MPMGGRHFFGSGDSARCFHRVVPSGVTDTVQLLRGVIESLTAASSDATVVVGVDDVHLPRPFRRYPSCTKSCSAARRKCC